MTHTSGGRLATRATGILLVLLGAVQLALLIALVLPVDWAWRILGVLGTIYGLGVFVAIGTVVASSRVRHEALLGILTLVAAVMALVGSLCWGSLLGGPLLLDTSETPRIWTILLADGSFGLWSILVAWDGAPPKAPGIAVLAALLAGRTVAEWAFFWPLLTSSTSPLDQPPGTSSGATAILLGIVILGGYVLVATWELVLGRWVALARPGPQRVP